MVRRHRYHARSWAVMVAIVLGAANLATVPPASANVAAVTGSAYGYHAFNLSLFVGSPEAGAGPAPVVALAPDASNSPQSATAGFGSVMVAETATLLSWDSITVNTAGTLGSNGSVTASATLQNVNKANPNNVPDTGSELLTADTVASTCTASETAVSGKTTITHGTIRTDSGLDQNGNGSYADPGDIHPVEVSLPLEPAANTVYEGIIRFNATSPPDTFRVVLNERLVATNSITVNAVHEYYGTTAASRLKGDLVIGQSLCGTTPQAMFTRPLQGATNVDTSQPFTWSTAPGAEAYYLMVGTTQGGYDLVNSGELATSVSSYSVPPLPAGPTLWARIYTRVGGTWTVFQDVSFTAAST